MTVPRMHDDEFDIDASLVRRLLASQFPHWAKLPIDDQANRNGQRDLSTSGTTWSCGCRASRERSRRWRRSARRLPKVAPHLPLAVPAPLAEGVPADGYPWVWSVYRWLEGRDATVERITDLGRRRATWLDSSPRCRRSIQLAARLPESTTSSAASRSLRDAAVRSSIDALRHEIDVDAVTAAWEAALRAPEWPRSPVWIHGDLDARNVLVQDGRLSAVIDWGSLGVGDPACDVMVAWKLLSADTRSAFREALSIDDATWARGRGWALSQALNALSYYTLETNAVLVRESRRWLAEVLPDSA